MSYFEDYNLSLTQQSSKKAIFQGNLKFKNNPLAPSSQVLIGVRLKTSIFGWKVIGNYEFKYR